MFVFEWSEFDGNEVEQGEFGRSEVGRIEEKNSENKRMNLSLDLNYKNGFGEFFVDSSNSEAFNWIHKDFFFGIIYGPNGSGKSHLSYLWLSKVSGQKNSHSKNQDNAQNSIADSEKNTEYIERPEHTNHATYTDMPDNFLFDYSFHSELNMKKLSEFDAYVINDVNKLFNSENASEWQKNLFNFFNFCLINGKKILFNSLSHISEWHFEFPDIESRLKSCSAVSLQAPSDSLLQLVIRRLFENYEIYVSSEIVTYIFLHADRSFESIHNVVDFVVSMSCMQKRSISIGFVRELFSQM